MDWWQEAADLARDPLAAMEFHEEWHMHWPRCQRCRKWMTLDHVASDKHQHYLMQHFLAERLLQEERQRAADRAPRHEHSSVVIEELVEVKELQLLTANEEPELVANDVEEPELPVANGAEDTELVTANEVEEPELVADVLATQHDIGTQTEPMMTEASTQTLRVWQVC